MAKTLSQIQAMITNKEDPRQIINEIADYLQANPPSPGGSSLEAVLTEGNDAGGLPIENLADPSNDQDAATKKYVDDNAGGSLLSATVELTDAQIKALPTTGVNIVAGQGAGKIIIPVNCYMRFNKTEGNYGGVNDAGLAFMCNGGLFSSVVKITEDLQNGGDYLYTALFSPLLPGSGGLATWIVSPYLTDNFSALANEPLQLKDITNGTDYTGGNAANTLKVTVYYVVVDL